MMCTRPSEMATIPSSQAPFIPNSTKTKKTTTILDLSNRNLSTEALWHGTPPYSREYITTINYAGNAVGKHELPLFLDGVVRYFPNVTHVCVANNPCCCDVWIEDAKKNSTMNHNDDNMMYHEEKEEEEERIMTPKELSCNISAMMDAAAKESRRMLRLYIIYRIPDIQSIDFVAVSEEERRLARPDTPCGVRVKREEWLTNAMVVMASSGGEEGVDEEQRAFEDQAVEIVLDKMAMSGKIGVGTGGGGGGVLGRNEDEMSGSSGGNTVKSLPLHGGAALRQHSNHKRVSPSPQSAAAGTFNTTVGSTSSSREHPEMHHPVAHLDEAPLLQHQSKNMLSPRKGVPKRLTSPFPINFHKTQSQQQHSTRHIQQHASNNSADNSNNHQNDDILESAATISCIHDNGSKSTQDNAFESSSIKNQSNKDIVYTPSEANKRHHHQQQCSNPSPSIIETNTHTKPNQDPPPPPPPSLLLLPKKENETIIEKKKKTSLSISTTKITKKITSSRPSSSSSRPPQSPASTPRKILPLSRQERKKAKKKKLALHQINQKSEDSSSGGGSSPPTTTSVAVAKKKTSQEKMHQKRKRWRQRNSSSSSKCSKSMLEGDSDDTDEDEDEDNDDDDEEENGETSKVEAEGIVKSTLQESQLVQE